MVQPAQGKEHTLKPSSQVRGGAHPIEHQGITTLFLGRIVVVGSRIQSNIPQPPLVELRKEGQEPMLVLVINRKRFNAEIRHGKYGD